jgi:hypothetical protein
MKNWWDVEPWWLIVLALPVVQVKNIMLYASTRETLAARIGTAICFLPVIAITTVVWLAVWGFALAMIWRLLGFK